MSNFEVFPLRELVEDTAIYPRTQISSVNVTNLVQALRAGCELPPIEADRKSKRIVDGYHRRRAYLNVLGPDACVPVRFVDYADDVAMLRAAVEANCRHGLGLQEVEKRRVVLRLTELGADDSSIASVLHVQPERVQKLRLHSASVSVGGGEIQVEALKRPLFHFSGKEMSPSQATAAKSAPGTSYRLLVRQLSDALAHQLIDASDTDLVADLHRLAELIESVLPQPVRG